MRLNVEFRADYLSQMRENVGNDLVKFCQFAAIVSILAMQQWYNPDIAVLNAEPFRGRTQSSRWGDGWKSAEEVPGFRH